MSHTTITDIGTVGIPVTDQDQAVEFFVAGWGSRSGSTCGWGRASAG